MDRKLVLFIVLLGVLSVASSGDLSAKDERLLSRKKRFLVFPEGSSLQLIFDWVVPMVGMPNIFTIGITAALAWQLPHDPTAPFHRPAEVIHRRVDKPNNNKTGLWYGGDIRPPSPYKYQQKYNDLLHNKYPQKYSNYYYTYKPLRYSTIMSSPAYRESLRRKNWYTPKRNELKKPKSNYVGLIYDQVHRTTRRDLYAKLGKLLASKQQDAKACLLKVICQINKVPVDEKGTFWQEILRAIFKIRSSPVDEKDEYDTAAGEMRDCDEMYSSCDLFK